MKWRTILAGLACLLFVASLPAFAQPASLSDIAGFESSLPSFWTQGNVPSGATLTWATDQFRSLGHSLKIEKPAATADSAAWVSQNMADIWSPTFGKDVDILLGAYVKTQGVNTNPANDDARWFIVYTFYDSAGAMLNETRLPIDQTTATSTGWMADTNQVGETILSATAWKLIVSFVAGKNATGTVWADDFVFYGRANAWAGQDWNTSVGVPTGWYYWMPPIGGNDGVLNAGFENTLVTTEAAHSGTHSIKFDMPAGRESRDGFVSTRRMIFSDLGVPDLKPGDSLRVSVWVKASGLQPDSAAAHPGSWGVGLTPQFFATVDNHAGFNGTGPDSVFHFPAVTSFDWTEYSTTFYVPKDSLTTIGSAKGPINSVEMRLHIYSTFVGTVYFDDLSFTRVPAGGASLADIAGFESSLPSFWTQGNVPSGATLTWATDQFRSLGHSLKIEKPAATADSAAWVSQNMADIWSPTFGKDVDILLGAYVKTQGVNTNPANDDARWFIVYTFYDSAGAMLNETRLPIDQTTATSTGWMADTNQVGETILSATAWKLIVSFVAGKNATGTVWADDFVFYGRANAWAGQDWNTSVGVPTGWYYWMPPIGGNDGVLNAGFENTLVTTEAAHSGTHSIKFDMPAGRESRDGFVSTRRMIFSDLGVPDLKPGDSLRVSVWVKASGLQPDSAAAHPGSWGVGLTPQFFATVDNHAGFNGTGPDSVFHFPAVTSFDWTEYSTTFYVPKDSLTTIGSAKGPINSVEMRLHIYSTFVGTVYFDDLSFTRISGVTSVEPVADNMPKVFELSNNYPNPFNPSTVIQYAVPRATNVSLVIYNILGQQVRTLVDEPQNAGRFTVTWDGRDNVGRVVGSGVYFYRLSAGETAIVKKMVMVK